MGIGSVSGVSRTSTVTPVSSPTGAPLSGSETSGASASSSSTQRGSTTSTQKSSGSVSQSSNTEMASTAASASETTSSSQTSMQTSSKQGTDKPVTKTEGVSKSAQKAAASTPVSRASARAAARNRDAQVADMHRHLSTSPVVPKAELPGSGMIYSNSGELMPNFHTSAKTTSTQTKTSKAGAKQRDVPRSHDVDDLTDPDNPMSIMMLIL